jgi:hypothetical protein
MSNAANGRVLIGRHGDLDIFAMDGEIPADAVNTNGQVVQKGEHTGHAHVLERGASVYDLPNGTRAIKVEQDSVTLDHVQHGKQTLKKGNYQVEVEMYVDPVSQLRASVVD